MHTNRLIVGVCKKTANSNYLMTSLTIFDIHEDALFVVIGCLAPLDFLSLSQTCSHFRHLSDPMKYSAMNKYWQTKCQQSWSSIKKSNYTTDNYRDLFKLMVDFIVWTINNNDIDQLQFSIIFKDTDLELQIQNKNKHPGINIKSSKIRQLACNIEMTMDKIVQALKNLCLSQITST